MVIKFWLPQNAVNVLISRAIIRQLKGAQGIKELRGVFNK
jgi:hypothetical protein